jgi:hypothetical protein
MKTGAIAGTCARKFYTRAPFSPNSFDDIDLAEKIYWRGSEILPLVLGKYELLAIAQFLCRS